MTLGLTHEKQLTLYAYALAIFALAVIARALIDFVVPGRLPFITFFPAVFLAAYYLGRGPALLVLVLSTLVGTAWADPTGESPIAFYIASALLFLVTALWILFRRSGERPIVPSVGLVVSIICVVVAPVRW